MIITERILLIGKIHDKFEDSCEIKLIFDTWTQAQTWLNNTPNADVNAYRLVPVAVEQGQ